MPDLESYSTILSTDVLSTHFDDPNWLIFDCRFDLQNPPWGNIDYQRNHIPGAIFADLERALSGDRTLHTGRHPLPDPLRFAEKLSGWGVSNASQVVVYDTVGGAFAARLWWMLRWLGHDRVAILDGGFGKWVREGRLTRSGIESRPPAAFVPRLRPESVLDAAAVDRLRQDPSSRLIDARSAIRYRGEQEPIDPIAGHIPGAVNRFHGDNLTPEGTFLPPDTLRARFEELLAGVPPERAVFYCGSGVTSCHHLVAMLYAGLPMGRLYPGSWSEWIRDPARPIALGPQP